MRGATILKLTVIAILVVIGLGEFFDGDQAIAGPVKIGKMPVGPILPVAFNPTPKPRVGDYYDSGCLVLDEGDPPTWPCGEDEFVFTVEGSNLHTEHLNATYNCCPDDIAVSLEMNGNTIWLIEEEVLPTPCDCDCCYNVEADIIDLAPGTYELIYEWFDYENWELHYYETQIIVPDPDLARVVDYGSFGCMDNPEEPQYPPCGDDVISYAMLESGLHVLHENATYNCCGDDIVIHVEVEGDTIYLTEEEIMSEGCYCICCFTVEAVIEGLAPGTYAVEFCWYNYETDTTMCDIQDIVIP